MLLYTGIFFFVDFFFYLHFSPFGPWANLKIGQTELFGKSYEAKYGIGW